MSAAIIAPAADELLGDGVLDRKLPDVWRLANSATTASGSAVVGSLPGADNVTGVQYCAPPPELTNGSRRAEHPGAVGRSSGRMQK
jgi:hypothetical protein